MMGLFNWTDRLGMYAAGVLFLAAAAGAGVLALGKHQVEGERDTTTAWAESACKAAGSFYRAENPKTHKLLPRKRWGASCATEIDSLATYWRTATKAANAALVTHNTEQAAKGATDRVVAQTNTTRRTRAKQKVETINASTSGDRRDGAYLRSLNELAGLSDAPEAVLGAASGGGAEGPAVLGPADLPVPPTGVPD